MKVPAMRPPPLKNPGLVPNGSLPLSPLHLDRLGLFNPDLMWRYQQQFGSSPHAPMSPLLDVKSRLPQSLATDPRSWTRDDVTLFLRWCEQEYDLPTVDQERFQMNGKAMCVLTKTDLSDRTGGAGDVIFNVLQMLLREVPYYGRVSQSPITPQQHSFMPFPQNGNALMSPPASARTPNSATWLPRSPFFVAETNGLGHLIQQTNSVAITDQKQNSPTEVKPLSFVNSNGSLAGSSSNSGSQSESEESSREAGSPRRSPIPSLISAPQSPATFSPTSKLDSMKIETQEGDAQSHGRLLWDFLQLLLNDNQSRYSRFIAWKHRESGVFKIVDPAGLAKLWGMQKNHPSMNYDKMSRALRYYYRVNILRKVQGERHCYQFLRNPSELKSIKNISMLRQQMQTQPPSTPTPIFDAKSEVKPEVEAKSEYYGHYTNEDCDMPTDLSINSERRHDVYTPEKYNPVRDDRISGRMQEFNFSQDPVELVCQPSFPTMDQEKLMPSPLQFPGTQPDLECQYQQNIRLIV